MTRSQLLFSGILLSSVAFIGGCGVGSVDHTATGTLALKGTVHGGQSPVYGSVIQLYTAGFAGNGSAAIPMINAVVTTDQSGNFDITGDYTCGKNSAGVSIGSPDDQVYIVASGGDPGLTPAADNTALKLVAALGTCSTLSTANFVEINEVTTAAAAWALSQFSVGAGNIGSTSSNAAGITNAFLDANLLADPSTGVATVLPTGKTIETDKLYGLADALASCVNSDGLGACSPLFTAATPSGVVRPTDTFMAALNIVKHPGQNVVAVYNTIGSEPPFPSGLTQAPNDWTMSLQVTGGGMLNPTALAIDQSSNVWVVGQNGPLSAFNAQGTAISDTGFGAGDIEKSQGIAIDINGDVWVTSYNTPYMDSGAVSKFIGATSPGTEGSVVLSGSNPGFTTGIDYPYGVSADTNGNIFVANSGEGSATVLTSAGSIYTNGSNVSGNNLGGSLELDSFPQTLAIDTNHGFWLPDGGATVSHITKNGVLSSTTTCCDGSWGVATDLYGNVWIANYYGDSFSEVAPDGTLLIDRGSVGGINTPQHLAIDGAQNVWIANKNAKSITEILSNQSAIATGTAISPTTGVYGTGGYGLDAPLNKPGYPAPDTAGNLWVSNQANNSVVMFFGVATPTITPITPTPLAP